MINSKMINYVSQDHLFSFSFSSSAPSSYCRYCWNPMKTGSMKHHDRLRRATRDLQINFMAIGFARGCNYAPWSYRNIISTDNIYLKFARGKRREIGAVRWLRRWAMWKDLVERSRKEEKRFLAIFLKAKKLMGTFVERVGLPPPLVNS